MVEIVLKEYLERLTAIEVLKPKGEEKRHVPSLSELAEVANLHRGSLNRIAHKHGSALRFSTANAIIDAMRNHYGFDMQINDLIAYVENSSKK